MQRRQLRVLHQLDSQRRGHRALDRGPGHFAVTLPGVAVADVEPSTVRLHGQEHGRSRAEFGAVEIASSRVRRHQRMLARSARYQPDNPEERFERHGQALWRPNHVLLRVNVPGDKGGTIPFDPEGTFEVGVLPR